MSPHYELFASFTAAVTLLCIYSFFRKRPSSLPLPPGPPKQSFFGHKIPERFEYIAYEQWGKDYDTDILHLRVAGSDIIILNSFEAVTTLFEKRAVMYSSRPQAQNTMKCELMGWSWMLSTLNYTDPNWKYGRSLLQKHFHPSNLEFHQPRQLAFARGVLLPQLLEGPDEIAQICRHLVGGIAISVAYGIKIQPHNDPFIRSAKAALAGIIEAGVPGTWLVDSIPILKYIPEWFPGAEFKRKARLWRQAQEDFRNKPYDITLDDLASGKARPSFMSDCLQDIPDGTANRNYHLEMIKNTSAIIFAAGADTLASMIESFFLAMLCFPDVQRKAQEELDRVVGSGRLPGFSDRGRLPYLAALVKEVLRWQPGNPAAVPHYATEEDTYKGYRIPKGAIMIGNTWALLHNEADYPEPLAFKPERFLNPDGTLNNAVRDPSTAAFGYGRRLCPGKDIGASIIWITAASVLAAFNIEKGVNNDGTIIEPSANYLPGVIRHPAPFKLTLKVRSKEVEDLIRNAEERLQFEF